MYENFTFKGLSTQVFRAYLNASSLQDFLTAAGKLLPYPIWVVDESYRILANYSSVKFNDEVMQEAFSIGYYSEALVREILNTSRELDLLVTDNTPVVRGPFLSPYKRLISRLYFRGNYCASLVLLCVTKVPREVENLLPLIGDLCLKFMEVDQQGGLRLDRQPYDDLFLRLIRGDVLTENERKILEAEACPEGTYSAFQLLTVPITAYNRIALGTMKRTFLEFFPDCWLLFRENNLQILRVAKEKLVPLAQVEEPLRQWMEKYELIAACSDEFRSLARVHEAYEKNRRTLGLAELMDDRTSLLRYDQYKFLDLILASVGEDEKKLEDFVPQNILDLRNYDKENKTEYFRTLKTLLQTDRNYILAAKELNTHRNTVAYRIARMRELFDIRIDEDENIFLLVYACYLLHYKDTISANRTNA